MRQAANRGLSRRFGRGQPRHRRSELPPTEPGRGGTAFLAARRPALTSWPGGPRTRSAKRVKAPRRLTHHPRPASPRRIAGRATFPQSPADVARAGPPGGHSPLLGPPADWLDRRPAGIRAPMGPATDTDASGPAAGPRRRPPPIETARPRRSDALVDSRHGRDCWGSQARPRCPDHAATGLDCWSDSVRARVVDRLRCPARGPQRNADS